MVGVFGRGTRYSRRLGQLARSSTLRLTASEEYVEDPDCEQVESSDLNTFHTVQQIVTVLLVPLGRRAQRFAPS